MKRVRIRFYGGLRDITQTAKSDMEVEDNATLKDVFDKLVQAYGDTFETLEPLAAEGRNDQLRVFVNRKRANSLDQTIDDEATVDLFPPVAGGCAEHVEDMTQRIYLQAVRYSI